MRINCRDSCVLAIQVNIAQSELVRAVALGPACQGQDSLVAVRRAINWACLSKGFVAAQAEDADEGQGPYLYKLTSVPVDAIRQHAKKVMDSHGYKDRTLPGLLQSENFR